MKRAARKDENTMSFLGIFGKKAKGPAAESQPASQTQTVPEKKPSGGGKKRTSGISQVLHESVLETALDKFRANDAFIRYENGQLRYVGIVLDTANIGGLDKKSHKDEAKGSIIECINSGRISTYITPDLMDLNYICIIPDPGTLSAMDEFSLLTEAPYEFCQVNEAGDVELLSVQTTFHEVSDLVVNDGKVEDLLKKKVPSVENQDDDSDFVEDDEPSVQQDPQENVVPVDDPEDDIPPLPDTQSQPSTESSEPEDNSDQGEPVSVENTDTGSDSGFLGDEGSVDAMYEQAMKPDAEAVQTVPSDFSDQTVIRRFYSEDLGLEVTSAPFDAQFMQGNPYVPFEEHRESGWINDQLNEMSREANLALAREHQSNQWLMRERYFRLLSLGCDRIRQDLDLHDESTQYGTLFAQLEKDRDDALSNMDGRIDRRKKEIEANWSRRLQEVGMEAARAAQGQYRQQYGKQHELEIYNIESSERAAINDDYYDGLHELLARRKVEANSLLELTITEVLNEISDIYMTALSDERTHYQQYVDKMQKFVDDHRQEDVARAQALAEELRQSDKADRVLAEQTAKMQSLSEDFKQRRESLLEEIENLKRTNAQAIADMKESHERDVDRWAKEKAEMEARYNQLLDQYQHLDEQKEREFEDRMQAMEDTNDALNDHCDHIVEVHRRSNLLGVFVMVASIIAALAIGYIGGEFVNTQRRVALEQQKIFDEADLDSAAQDDSSTAGAGE